MLITDIEKLKQYVTERRVWQGIPSIEVTEAGRIFITFYSGGTSEGFENYCVLIKSDSDGADFSEPIAVAYLENHRCFDPCLWIDPLNRLWFTWAKSPEDGLYGAICDNPDADEIVFGDEFFIGHNVMMNKPTVLSNGEWAFPLAVWNYGVWGPLSSQFASSITPKGSYLYVTDDGGKTFRIKSFADVKGRSFDEHKFLELNDGTLRVYVRAKYGIGMADSYDDGITWEESVDSELGGPDARFHIRRLPSGKLLLINHHDFNGRNNLTALLSDDEGKTWKWKLLLDSRSNVSYPDVSLHNGYIYITYDRERGDYLPSFDDVYQNAREILFAKITEKDIMAGKIISSGSRLACVASKLGKYYQEASEPYEEISGLMNFMKDNDALDKFIDKYSKEELIEKIFNKFPIKSYWLSKIKPEKLDELVTTFENTYGIDKQTIYKILELLEIAYTYKKQELTMIEEEGILVSKIKNIVNKNLDINIGIHGIANELRLSRSYICHIFRKVTGVTIDEYRKSKRR